MRVIEVINWLLENGSQIGWPANLMTIGPYQDYQDTDAFSSIFGILKL